MWIRKSTFPHFHIHLRVEVYPLQYCTITLKKESIGIGSFLLYCFFAVSALDLQADAGEEAATIHLLTWPFFKDIIISEI